MPASLASIRARWKRRTLRPASAIVSSARTPAVLPTTSGSGCAPCAFVVSRRDCDVVGLTTSGEETVRGPAPLAPRARRRSAAVRRRSSDFDGVADGLGRSSVRSTPAFRSSSVAPAEGSPADGSPIDGEAASDCPGVASLAASSIASRTAALASSAGLPALPPFPPFDWVDASRAASNFELVAGLSPPSPSKT